MVNKDEYLQLDGVSYNNISEYKQHSRQCTALIKNKLFSDGLISMIFDLPVI